MLTHEDDLLTREVALITADKCRSWNVDSYDQYVSSD